jgi:hypothetical protein
MLFWIAILARVLLAKGQYLDSLHCSSYVYLGFNEMLNINSKNMRSLYLSILAVLVLSSGFSQLTITDFGATEDLNGTFYYVSGSPSDFDVEHGFDVTNVSNEDLVVGCRRIEVDVTLGEGVQNTLCWKICPAYMDAGAVPTFVSSFDVEMSAGMVDSSFVMHLRPNLVDGCSLFRIEWFNFDDDTEIYATMDMMYDHSDNVSCAVGLNEFANIETSIAPNPANERATLTLEGVNRQVNLQVMDLLGQTVSADVFNPAAGNVYEFNTSDLRNGIYFVSILGEGEILKTIKLVVKH